MNNFDDLTRIAKVVNSLERKGLFAEVDKLSNILTRLAQNDPETDAWMAWCREKGISHCNWAVNDKAEEWSILVPGSGATGHWNDQSLSEAGKLAREIIRGW